jgi:hypothetical protein
MLVGSRFGVRVDELQFPRREEMAMEMDERVRQCRK